MIKKPTAPTSSGPKRTGSMTPRTAAVAARPSSGLKKDASTKGSPSPPPSSQAATRPPVPHPAPAATPVLTSLPDYVEYFLARMQHHAQQANTNAKCTDAWRRIGAPPLDAVRGVAASTLREDPTDGSAVAALTVVPNEATATLRCFVTAADAEGGDAALCEQHLPAASVTVAVDAGAAGKPMCWTDAADGQDVVRMAALNHAGGSKAPLCVSWRGPSWSIRSDALQLEGCGAQTAGGANVQRGCVSLSTKDASGSSVVVVSVAAQAATPNQAAVITSTLTTPSASGSSGTPASGGAGSDTFTHAGDESITVFKYNAADSNNKGRPASGAEARRRVASIDIMDGLASYTGSVDVQSKRLQGQGALSVVTGSSSSAKYDGSWADSMRHGSTGAWRMSLASVTTGGIGVADSNVVVPAATSVEYTGPWSNDARHGANGRLSIRLAAAPNSGGSSTTSGGGSNGGGIHIDADWEHGELHNAATLATIDDTKQIATCHFDAGSLAPKTVLSFATGKFIGQWSNPKDVARVALALSKRSSASGASGTSGCGVPPVELLMQNVSSAGAILTRASDAMGAIDCANRTIVNPLLADQVRGPVAEVLASNVACALTRYAAALMLSKQIQDAHAGQLETARKTLKKAQQDLSEQQGEVSKVEKRLTKSQSDRDAANKKLQELTAQHQAALQSLEGHGAEGSDGSGMDKSKLLLQSIRALATEKATLEGSITELAEALTQLKADVRKLAQRRDGLQKEIKSMDAEVQQGLERIAAIDPLTDAQAAKLLQVEQDSGVQQEKLEATRKSLADQLAALQKRVADLDSTEEGSMSAASPGDDAAEQIKMLKSTIATTKKDIEEIERQKTAEERRAQLIAKGAAGTSTTAEEHASELKRLTEGIEASKTALEMKRADMDALSASLAKLRDALDAGGSVVSDPPEHVTQRTELQDALQKLNDLFGKTRGQMHKKTMELEQLKEEVARLETDVDAAKRVPMRPPVPQPVDEDEAPLPSPPPPRPVRVATPPPDPRIGELEAAIKAAIAKQDGLRRKQENINERIEQLSNQKRVIEDKRDRRAKEDAAEAALRASQQVSQSQDGLTAVMMDGSIPELKAFLVKMKEQNTQYESENVVLRTKAEAVATAVADAKRQASSQSMQQGSSTSSVDWRTKALQDEVDAREARINALRGELKRTHLLEAKIQSAKESIKAMTQSAEIRQTQAVQIAKADMDWSASVSLARRQSSGAGRSAFF